MLPPAGEGMLSLSETHRRRQAMHGSETNEAVTRRCFENASQGNFDALDESSPRTTSCTRRRSAAPTA
jgi:hypothetical protein